MESPSPFLYNLSQLYHQMRHLWFFLSQLSCRPTNNFYAGASFLFCFALADSEGEENHRASIQGRGRWGAKTATALPPALKIKNSQSSLTVIPTSVPPILLVDHVEPLADCWIFFDL